MIAQISGTSMTPEEYLAFEETSPIKHEYVNGQVFAMSGGTDAHNTIALNAAIALRTHLRGTGCQTYIADVKVQPPIRNYYYPDVFVTCDPADRETSKYKRFPKLIIEVLSASTEAFDRGDKFIDYQKIESLEEYVLINTRHQRVEVFRRSEGQLWLLQGYDAADGQSDIVVELKSVGLSIPLAALYEDANLEVSNEAAKIEEPASERL